MVNQSQVQKAEAFKAMHDGREILVLPNASDVGSAKMVVEAGYRAIATSSAGVAWLMGYPDGQKISRTEMLSMVSRIARALDVPVTADMEAGYGTAPEAVARTVRETIEAGAVGLNIEDGAFEGEGPLIDSVLAAERITAGREAADAAGVPMVINARTDVFLKGGRGPEALDVSIERANAYRAAGADCLFVPFAREADTISALCEGINGPVNILASSVSPPIHVLAGLGVARVSIGGLMSLAFATLARQIATELKVTGTYGFADGVVLHPEMNDLLSN